MYGAVMFDDADMVDAIFRRATGDEPHRLYLLGGRPPGVVRLPVDDDWFEEFRIDCWENGQPVFVSTGYVSRE